MIDTLARTTEARRALKRMLANGPLTMIPKRPQAERRRRKQEHRA